MFRTSEQDHYVRYVRVIIKMMYIIYGEQGEPVIGHRNPAQNLVSGRKKLGCLRYSSAGNWL